MIELCVKDYCHGCAEFSPDVRTIYGDRDAIEQIIVCDNQYVCERIKRYLNDKLKKENGK